MAEAEHQPRFYYWISINSLAVGLWNAESLISAIDSARLNYDDLRAAWIRKIKEGDPKISPKQSDHMANRNRNLNLAIRLAKTFEEADPIWTLSYEQQRLAFDREYKSLHPLIKFFN